MPFMVILRFPTAAFVHSHLQDAAEPSSADYYPALRWDKPEGRLILMIPALWAVFFEGMPRYRWWALFWVLSLPVPLGAL